MSGGEFDQSSRPISNVRDIALGPSSMFRDSLKFRNDQLVGNRAISVGPRMVRDDVSLSHVRLLGKA